MTSEARARLLAGVLALLLAAVVAATFDGAGWPEGIPLPQRTATEAEPTPDASITGEGETEDHRLPEPEARGEDLVWLRTVVSWIVAALMLGTLVAILSMLRLVVLRRRLRGDMNPREAATGPAPQEADAEAAEVEAMLQDTLAGLDQGNPRNAVVACWVRLEELATARGLPRQPADTPSEFVARALQTYALDAAALDRLADLYREARFSSHPMGEEQRTEARTCLERLAEGVRRGVVVA